MCKAEDKDLSVCVLEKGAEVGEVLRTVDGCCQARTPPSKHLKVASSGCRHAHIVRERFGTSGTYRAVARLAKHWGTSQSACKTGQVIVPSGLVVQPYSAGAMEVVASGLCRLHAALKAADMSFSLVGRNTMLDLPLPTM